ncbi:hypothetical protein B0J11DRAFT_611673 [Dendryphion nanum]|uniref:Uncharacterized protein n=1 Tax=Dendryphion nanum TaxID=256645 RepID=A0A9P9EE43_9PLEO|nr:hypothetical protein B0J11DRAFT_611673 [Dendryphion nanum]
MFFARYFLSLSLPFLALGAKRQSATDTFQLYAYGEGLGGLPVFNAGGDAYVGNPNSFNSSDAAEVIFNPTENAWVGTPNATATNGTAPNWSNVTFSVPGSSSGRVKFLDSNSSNSDYITAGFVFYGSTAMFTGNGELESLWYAEPQADGGAHALYWNTTSEGQIPVTLRRMAPSSPPPSTEV